MVVTEEQAKTHYIEHESKPFFGSLISYITSGPVFAMVWEGKDSVALTRSMIGATKPTDAAPGTIRGDYAVEMSRNLIHGSDSVETLNGKSQICLKPMNWFLMNKQQLNGYMNK